MYSGHQPPPPNYVILGNQYEPPPPYYQPQPYGHRGVPRYDGHRSGSGLCLKCICCCYCLLFMLIFMAMATLILAFIFLKPKVPIYKLEDFNVKSFAILPNMTVTTDFVVTVRAENPNTRIGFLYGQANSVTVSFEEAELCRGKVPAFHQGHENITMLQIPMGGRAPFGSGLHDDFLNGEKEGRIPLLIQIKIPISVELDSIPIMHVLFRVNCDIVVDDLRPDKKPKILSAIYSFGFA